MSDDIQQTINRADAGRWGGVLPGSVYHALKKLEQEGEIALTEVAHTGHRQRALYRITNSGRGRLRQLTAQAPREPAGLYPTALYSGLSLLDQISRAEARQALEDHKRALEAEYRALEAGERSNAETGEAVSTLSRLTIENMFDIIQQQMEFVEKLLHALEEGPR